MLKKIERGFDQMVNFWKQKKIADLYFPLLQKFLIK